MASTSDVRQGIKFTTRHFRVAAEAEKEINKMLRMSREASVKPSLLCLLIDEEPRVMMKRIVHLSLFPQIRIHVQEPPSLLNVMEWQRVVAKRVCKHYFNSFIYVKRAGHVLWASPSSRPDLGGKELDDLRLSADWKPLTVDETVLLNTPSFCGSICIEFALEAVAVTALVQRGRLLEAEGADDTVAFDSSAALPSDSYNGLRNTISAFDEGAAVDAALKVLKLMLTECVRDIAHSANKRADQIVMSLSRWLHSSNALLFDPAITRSVGILEKKLVLLLAAECERLGAKIIHATPTRLVLDTGKCELEQGTAFTDLLLQSLGQNPLFAALHMRPTQTWSTLLWYDGHNFTGICEKAVESIDEDRQPTESLALKAETQHYWRMSDDLPTEGAIREEFRKIATGYVMLFMQEQRKTNFDSEAAVKFRNDLIKQHIGHRLFRVISKLAGQRLTHHAAASLVNVTFAKSTIDQMIADRLNMLMTAYFLQDHVCSKCKSIRRDNISKYCECSGEFANTITAAELLRDAKTACDIGEQFDLPITVEISRWMCAGVEVNG
ncbi:hypothetical protein TELCIR_00122 [Teladorsagia circumcincta]|uniref:DNA polymerase epsilon catalytic subunit n=1 Tax=Teladorsagia circumcincta TaxID=45464 RepID=A0A2G9V6V6_TELCI|nr:hypothetical protein TELCIR_00122 [Teladorsagia circumcincta]